MEESKVSFAVVFIGSSTRQHPPPYKLPERSLSLSSLCVAGRPVYLQAAGIEGGRGVEPKKTTAKKYGPPLLLYIFLCSKVLEKYDIILAAVLGLIVILIITGIFVKFRVFTKVRLYKVSQNCQKRMH